MVVLVTVSPPRDYPGAVPTGGIARCLAERLLEHDVAVRVLTPGDGGEPWPSAAEVMVGDITRPEETPAAFDGVEAVFLAGAIPETAHDVVRRAAESGGRRIVLLTSHGPDYEIAFPPEDWYWLAVEVVVERSGLEWVRILPSAVMESVRGVGYPTRPSWPDLVRTGGTIAEPYPDARLPFVHEDDVAAVAVAALLDDNLLGRTVHASGPTISRREMAATIGEVTGRQVPFAALTAVEARELWRSWGWDDEDADHTLGVLEHFAAHPAGHSSTLTEVLGRPPKTFADWVREHLELFL